MGTEFPRPHINYLLQSNPDGTFDIDTRVMIAEVAETLGLTAGQIVHITGEGVREFNDLTLAIPKIKIASADEDTHFPIFGVILDDGDLEDNVRVVNNGIIKGFDTSGGVEGDPVYLGLNGEIVFEPVSGINGIAQVGVITDVDATLGGIQITIAQFIFSAEFDDTLRYLLVNSSGDSNAASAFTAKNDLGHIGSFGISGSTNSGGGDAVFFFSEGFGDMAFVNDGDKPMTWAIDPTDSHNLSNVILMTLKPNGILEHNHSYGAMFQNNASTLITILATSTFVEIDGMSSGSLNGFTFQNGSELKTSQAGKYKVDWSITFTNGNIVTFEGGVLVNGTVVNQTIASRQLGANDVGNMSGTGIVTLAVDDLLELGIANITNLNDPTIESANISLIRVGE